MNIWRFALTVAISCSIAVLAFVIGFAAYNGKLSVFTISDIFELIGFTLFLAVFIMVLITFPYFWFKTARSLMSARASSNDSEQRLFRSVIRKALSSEGSRDWLAMLGLCALIPIIIWFGHTFFGVGN